MLTKVCTKCSVEKTVDCFYKCNKGKFGTRSVCKHCVAVYRQENKVSMATWRKDYLTNNKDKVAKSKRIYHQKNLATWRAKAAKRKAIKLQATPFWVDDEAVNGMYQLATIFNRTGLNLHVDHIVPLNSDMVCGLHCEANLQLLPASDNISKGNRHWPDMW